MYLNQSGIVKLAAFNILLKLIIATYGTNKELTTYKRVTKRIDCIFWTKIISKYITESGILSFDTVDPSNHRAIYLNINIIDFLQYKMHLLIPTTRLLSTINPDAIAIYKSYMIQFIQSNDIMKKINKIDNKIQNKSITCEN